EATEARQPEQVDHRFCRRQASATPADQRVDGISVGAGRQAKEGDRSEKRCLPSICTSIVGASHKTAVWTGRGSRKPLHPGSATGWPRTQPSLFYRCPHSVSDSTSLHAPFTPAPR